MTYSKSSRLLNDGQHPGMDVVGVPTLNYTIAKKKMHSDRPDVKNGGREIGPSQGDIKSSFARSNLSIQGPMIVPQNPIYPQTLGF